MRISHLFITAGILAASVLGVVSESPKRPPPAFDVRSRAQISTPPMTELSKSSNLGGALSTRGGVENSVQNALLGVVAMAMIEKGVKGGLKSMNIKFPAQLGGCIALFAVMMIAEAIDPKLGNGIYDALLPGAGLLATWLPVFFVPGLALLPLSPKVGTGVDVSTNTQHKSVGF